MKKFLKKLSASAVLVPALVFSFGLAAASVVPAFAATDAKCDVGSGLGGALAPECTQGAGQTSDLNAQVVDIINIMLFVIGILAVIMIIFGGIRYAISGGASDKVKDAKNTIVYAVVGLVVAILAWAIVNWVFGQFAATP